MDKGFATTTGSPNGAIAESGEWSFGIRKLRDLFTGGERKSLAWLSAAVLVRGLAETLALAVIMPFIAVVSNPSVVRDNPGLRWLYQVGGFQDSSDFLLLLGISVLLVLALSNAFAACTTWAMERFVWKKHHDLTVRLLSKYLHQPYSFFLNRNTAELSKNVLSEVTAVTMGILVPLMLLVSRGTVALCVVLLLIGVDWGLAVVVLLVLGGAYGLVYAVVHRKQGRIGEERVEANSRRFQYAAEAFGGIKETKVADAEAFFLNRFAGPSKVYSGNTATDQVVAQIPRYALEVVAFGGILLIIIVLLSSGGEVSQALPLIGLYAFAGYKLMPSLQLVFQGLTTIRFNLASLEKLHSDLCPDGGGIQDPPSGASDPEPPSLVFRDRVAVQKVSFRYPGADDWAIRGVDLEIPAGTSLGIVGFTGCGKTTLMDLLLGLLAPTEGALEVDGIELDSRTVPRWREIVSYVPQDIFLLDDTIRNNIAFGAAQEEIDERSVTEAAEAAGLSAFLTELSGGLGTVVGDRGVRLSGGQKQRIGIARALYRNPPVLFLDEATSALDGVTEETVMKRIRETRPGRTLIVIAHRLGTVKGLDRICLLEDGAIKDSGSYAELLERSPDFRAMAGEAE